jgi:hypothetical protein
MLRKPIAILVALTTLLSILTIRGTTSAQIDDDIYANRMSYAEAIAIQAQAAPGDNLLINGDFDQLGFYWRPTNHYVGGMWYEWWGNYNAIPEFIDGGHPHHNECYPKPADGRCHDSSVIDYNNSSQGYIRMGAPFIAGVYQQITENIVPCTPYTFEMWNRNDSASYGARVGIDSTGWVITRLGDSGPDNCPPDGKSRCPDPYIGGDHGFPSTTIWSTPSYHKEFTWAPLSVTVEAASDTLSVWTYAAPSSSGSLSTYWDNGSLVQVPFPDGRLPEPATWVPSGFISQPTTSFANNTLTIQWETQDLASTQVWYTIQEASEPVTTATAYSNTVYMPIISKFQIPRSYMTALDTTPTLQHQVTITGLESMKSVTFVALSRHSLGTSCATETSELMKVSLSTGETTILDMTTMERLLPTPTIQNSP